MNECEPRAKILENRILKGQNEKWRRDDWKLKPEDVTVTVTVIPIFEYLNKRLDWEKVIIHYVTKGKDHWCLDVLMSWCPSTSFLDLIRLSSTTSSGTETENFMKVYLSLKCLYYYICWSSIIFLFLSDLFLGVMIIWFVQFLDIFYLKDQR